MELSNEPGVELALIGEIPFFIHIILYLAAKPVSVKMENSSMFIQFLREIFFCTHATLYLFTRLSTAADDEVLESEIPENPTTCEPKSDKDGPREKHQYGHSRN